MEAVLLLVTGASGAGKTSVRESISGAVGDDIEAVELRHLGAVPANPDIAWRQRMAEQAVVRAAELAAQHRHLLLAGDPVAPGEVLAAPSAPSVDIAVCLLDVTAQVQRDRLRRRGDPDELLPHHVAFADWMRRHAADPRHMPHVLADGGWAEMRWSRLHHMSTDDWQITVIDGSPLSTADTSQLVLQWIRDAVSGRAPVFRRATE
jgi:energy-coupling factor transporter ATP-binding protein EcfA2